MRLRFDDVEGVEDFGSGLGSVAGMFKVVALLWAGSDMSYDEDN